MKKKMIGFVFLSLLPVSLVARGQDTETTRRAPSQEEVTIHDGQQEKASKAWALAWKIPQTEEPGRMRSMGSRRVRHD